MTMKKQYIVPTLSVVVTEDLCDTGLKTGSVFEGSVSEGKQIDQFQVVEQSQTKQEFSGLWGSSNKDKWGDD